MSVDAGIAGHVRADRHSAARPASHAPSPLFEAAAIALTCYVDRGHRGPWDCGPMVLAHLLSTGDGAGAPPLGVIADTWLEAFPAYGLGLHGGAAGLSFGLGLVAEHSDLLASYHLRICASLEAAVIKTPWNAPARDWPDYDLVTGASGVLLALLQGGGLSAGADAVAAHLALLVGSAGMSALRITDCGDDDLRAWNLDTVNLGLAHGLAGPLAALTAYCRAGGIDTPAGAALRTAARWLAEAAHEDALGLVTWAPGWSGAVPSRSAASPRQAWCYGAPSTAFVLWAAGNVLGEAEMQALAVDAFERFAAAFDPAFHLDSDRGERIAICHGEAGIMAMAHRFAQLTGSRPAAMLADRLEAELLARLPDIVVFASENPTLQAGGFGVLAALIARQQEEWSWTPALGLC